MIGKTLSHYQVIEKLGEGGMGLVYKARDTHLDRFVAIKVLPAEKVADPDRKRRFVQEAKAASALNHPNIIHVYDIDQADGTDFIAMEFVAGKTLDALIPRSGMRIGQTLKIAIQVAEGLSKAHEAGIIHRDLKPSNFMVTDDGLVKILDFGLAKLCDRHTGGTEGSTERTATATESQEGTIAGTVAYMSPEQAEGKAIGPRSDIFSFGSVLYEMVTGRRAFHGDSPASTLASVMKDDPKPPRELTPDLPRNLERVIHRCLRKDPARRWQHIDDIKVELEELKQESDSQVATLGPLAAKRRWRWLWATSAVVAVLATAGTWLWLDSARSDLPPPRVVPLTTTQGLENWPTFSQDGNQVAFAWSGERLDNWDIWVKVVGETHALRLTTDPAPDLLPAWSPDGKHIAFFRGGTTEKAGLYLVSPLGGAERKISDFRPSARLSWTPDGKWLVATRPRSVEVVREDLSGVYLISVDGRISRRITFPKSPLVDGDAAVSPDGKSLAFARSTALFASDIYCQELGPEGSPKGEARRLTSQNSSIVGVAWIPDGKSIVYGSSRFWGMKHYLWRVGRDGGRPERLEYAGPYASTPAISSSRNRLAFVQRRADLDIWRVRVGEAADPFISSTLVEMDPQYSPDGKKVAFSSDRAGETYDIWVANADGSQPVQLTHEDGAAGTPRWSPDGRKIVFDLYSPSGEIDLYTINANGGLPERLTREPSSETLPTYSPDGKWIYFNSNRSGTEQVWRMPATGGQAEQITKLGADVGLVSPDGKTLYFIKRTSPDLFALPAAGGNEEVVAKSVGNRTFFVTTDGIYFIGRPRADARSELRLLDPQTSKTRLLSVLDGRISQGLTVSPDRKTLLYTKSGEPNSDLMLVENFR